MSADAAQILVIDDDRGVVDYLTELLASHDLRAAGETNPLAGLERIAARAWDLVICDVEMPGMRGIDLLAAAQLKRPGQLVLLITAFGSIDLAVQALRAGACDFLTKPFPGELLVHRVKRALSERSMRREIVRLQRQLGGTSDRDIVARSPAMRQTLELARRAARTSVSVLLTGESGAGKGRLARWIHEASPRKMGPMVAINCAALPSALVEAELFGVRRGAFTDAREDRAGLFLEANNGTLLLDEIGEMPLETQPKLLQVLEGRKVRPVGGNREADFDVRVLAATNRNLEDDVAQHRFREDLYYRLNVLRINVPPLRARTECMPELVDQGLRSAATRLGRPMVGIAGDAMRVLLHQNWPGNVRELANVLERAVALSEHDTLTLPDVQGAIDAGRGRSQPKDLGMAPLSAVEMAHITRVLEAVGGHKVMAAKILGIDRKTLYRKLGEQEVDG